jgi:hypothetical protein
MKYWEALLHLLQKGALPTIALKAILNTSLALITNLDHIPLNIDKNINIKIVH